MASKRRKRKKYVPAYIALYGIIIIIAVLLIVIISKIAGGSNQNNENDTTSDTLNRVTEGGTTDNTSNSADNTDEATTTAAKLPVIADEDDWALYVIGNNNPLPGDFTVEIKTVAGERTLDKRCADYAIQMLNDAKSQNVGLYVTSAYRSIQYQADNLQNYISRLMAQGYTEEEATKQAHKEIALPGHSEHNAGLALDIVSDDYWSNHSDLDESFDKLPQYEWLVNNSWKYGFILSYPKGKENITGFIYEPWHYRFVGLEHAKKIHEVYEATGEFLTVNEYIEQYYNR
ncbi:MAG TPA: hypothetical protein DDX91_06505 [Ruminococcaceae bacterium]|nr:hypothetical protein [Oscillospiraceae bacterium]